MKLAFLFACLITIATMVTGQAPEEILWNTEHAYRALTNYVDEGRYTREIYGNLPLKDSARYFIALDKRGNINHWFREEKYGTTHGAHFTKSEEDSLGTYTRLGTDDPPFTCTPDEAAGRLLATGGGILFLTGSLFYPDFLSGWSVDSSIIQHYDQAKRLDDTMINGAQCFVIKTKRTIVTTQEMADRVNYQRDSIQGLLDLPPEQRASIQTKAGPSTFTINYFIRQKDYMIVRKEQFNYKDGVVSAKTTLWMEPKYDVQDFGEYLQKQ